MSSSAILRATVTHRIASLYKKKFLLTTHESLSIFCFRSYSKYPPHTIIPMPALSPTMTQGNLAKWHLSSIPCQVNVGDVLAEIETDKATMEFEAPQDGWIVKTLVEEGAKDIPVGQPIAVLVEEESDVKAMKDFKLEEERKEKPETKIEPVHEKQNNRQPSTLEHKGERQEHEKGKAHGVLASPAARVLASKHRIDLAEVKGTGPSGRITKEDIQLVINGQESRTEEREERPSSTSTTNVSSTPSAAAQSTQTAASYKDIPLSNVRRVISQRLSLSSSTIPHYYLTMTIPMDRLFQVRQVINTQLANGTDNSSSTTRRLSINDFLIKACALAMRTVPEVNSAWIEEEKDGKSSSALIRIYDSVDVSIAVATDQGLITPVIKKVQTKGLLEIASETRHLTTLARSNKLYPEQFQGGTFTVSNLGSLYRNIEHFTAIINPPQACILAISGVHDKCTHDPSASTCSSQKVMKVTLSCDHRIVDGAMGAKWLQALYELLQEPASMVL